MIKPTVKPHPQCQTQTIYGARGHDRSCQRLQTNPSIYCASRSTVVVFTLCPRIHCVCSYIAPHADPLCLCLHCARGSIVFVYTLRRRIHCVCVYITPADTLCLCLHCARGSIVFVYTLRRRIHCVCVYIAPADPLCLCLHCFYCIC